MTTRCGEGHRDVRPDDDSPIPVLSAAARGRPPPSRHRCSRKRPWRRVAAAIGALALLVLAGCALQPTVQAPPRSPAQVRDDIVQRMPATVPDRAGWAADIQVALTAQRIAPSSANICAVLAVVQQESSFQANPPVPGLPGIARREIDRRAAALHVPRLLVDAALRIHSPDGRDYAERLAHVRTEQDLSDVFEEFIGTVPMGRRLFAGLNPVHTAGPMQVGIAFARAHAKGYPYPVDGSIRHEVFTRRGGLYFGVAHLLGYPADYADPMYRFADFNAGWYASRNAAFQAAVSRATGIPLALDGDLLKPGAALDAPGTTETAVRVLGPQLGMGDAAIRRALARGDAADFADTTLYRRVFALAEAMEHRPLPRAILPGITLHSPKITRKLTTAWFAERVAQRWKRCMARGP